MTSTEPIPNAALALAGAGRSHRVADHVRLAILDGTFGVGTRLSEPQICRDLHVSRNTLREAFRALAEERLVVHELNRGVFVRTPTVADVSELYDVRRLVECAAIQTHPGDRVGVGAADIDFHLELTALGSTRIEG